MRRIRVGALLLTATVAVSAESQQRSVELNSLLQTHFSLTQADFADLDRGEVVSKALRTREKSEVASFGIVHVAVTPEFYLERFRDIENFKQGPQVLAIRKFSVPPRLEDLDGLGPTADDLRDLRDCRVGHCDIKLPAAVIEKIQREIDWKAPDSATAATRILREMLLNYVAVYLRGGNRALAEYNDKETPVRVAEEFDALLEASPYLPEYSPEFFEYLDKYPDKPLPGAENFLYGSMEKFGLKPTLSLTHVTIYRQSRGVPRPRVLIASKQIYASHYFDASLGLTAAVLDADGSGIYLMYLNRSRADGLDGAFSGIKRWILEGRIVKGMNENLKIIRTKLEAAYPKGSDH